MVANDVNHDDPVVGLVVTFEWNASEEFVYGAVGGV